MATLAQVMNLTPTELQQMCRYLGHTTKVHLTHYRTMSPYIERVTLGKVLLMQDMNIQNKFVGKALEEIDFMDIIKERHTDDTALNMEPTDTANGDTLKDEFNIEAEMVEAEHNIEAEDQGDTGKRNKQRKKTSRQRWSEKEMTELTKYFSDHLKRKVMAE